MEATALSSPVMLFAEPPHGHTWVTDSSQQATPVLNTPGVHSITSKYGGDANYAASSSPAAVSISVKYPTVTTATALTNSINLGQSVQVAVAVTTTAKNPPMTGTLGVLNTNLCRSPQRYPWILAAIKQ